MVASPPSCPACMRAALMRWACQRMTSLPTAMPVAHAPLRFLRCSRPMPCATLTRLHRLRAALARCMV